MQEKVGVNNYKIILSTGVKTFHANLLKCYHVADNDCAGLDKVESVAIDIVESEDSKVDAQFDFPADVQSETFVMW